MNNNDIIPTNHKALRDSVNYHFQCDINSRCRERRFVNARMTFAWMMKKRGYSLSSIGRMMGRNHATIIHYLKNVEWYVKTDFEFKETFDLVYQDCYLDDTNVHLLGEEDLKKEVFSLRKELKDVYSQIESLKNDQLQSKRDDERFEDIIQTIKVRTHPGKEELVLNKLNLMYNGLHN